ncbi:hypothetical protein F4810DRAFT_609162 [Camillea tinctor]|nr:hypothetical protein F4810DRAFT_609162 [Camillea tinctor]
MDEAEAVVAAEATYTASTNASPPITANVIGDDDDADVDRVVGATAAATGAATAVAASAAGAAAGVVTSGFSTTTKKKRTNSNNMPVMTATAVTPAPASPSTNEKRSQQLLLARERGGPRFFGPCPVVNSDAIWDEICICHQSAQYHLAEYSRLYKSLHMTPTNPMPTTPVAAEDDIDVNDNNDHDGNRIVRVEDLSSSPDAWRLKVERDFAMRDLRVVKDRLEVVASARPRLSRGAVSLSAISAVGLLAANQLSHTLSFSSSSSTSTSSSIFPSVFSSGLVVSLLVSVLYQLAPWLRRALAGYCASSVSAVLERLRDFGALPASAQENWQAGGGGREEVVQYWWFLSTARWLEVLRWLPSADGGVY